MITEEFLYHIWQYKKWKKNAPLLSTNGEAIEVLAPGQRNEDAGPDFFNARIKIGKIIFAGNVEIHKNASDWFLHHHQENPAYHNLILHVVYNDDCEEPIGNFPTLVLKHFIDKKLIDSFSSFYKPFQFIPCESFIATLEPFIITSYWEKLFIDRLEKKSVQLQKHLHHLKGDWEQLLFRELCYSFGLKINAEPFYLLAKSFDFNILRSNPSQAEALLLGQAGFLESPQDPYTLALQQAYIFLQKKYKLNALENHLFKFLRLRPANFPTLRIAQLATIYTQQHKLFSSLLSCATPKDYYNFFEQFNPSKYWDNHYKLGVESKKKENKNITKSLIDKILINAWLPILFLYKKEHSNFDLEKFFLNYQALPAEKNQITDGFATLGIKTKTAMESQACVELKNNFCNRKKCLSCRVGYQMLKNANRT